MNVPLLYCIIDDRQSFVQSTFSDYKKTDVVKQFSKSLIDGKVQDACFLMVELHISGYMDIIWREVFNVMGRNINIENPYLPNWILTRLNKYNKIIDKYFDKKYLYENRNNQEIRNIFTEVICVICMSNKNKLFSNRSLPKIKEYDFSKESIRLKITSKNVAYVNEYFNTDENNELKLAINEIMNNIFNDGKIANIVYWYKWIINYERMCKKNNLEFKISRREIVNIKDKYKNDWVWLLWEIVLSYKNKVSENKIIQINSLLEIYKWKYTGNTTKKEYLILHMLILIKFNINKKIPIIKNNYIRIRACCNINQIYKLKKQKIDMEEDKKKLRELRKIIKPSIKIKTDNHKREMKIQLEYMNKIKLNKINNKMNYFNNIIIYK